MDLSASQDRRQGDLYFKVIFLNFVHLKIAVAWSLLGKLIIHGLFE